MTEEERDAATAEPAADAEKADAQEEEADAEEANAGEAEASADEDAEEADADRTEDADTQEECEEDPEVEAEGSTDSEPPQASSKKKRSKKKRTQKRRAASAPVDEVARSEAVHASGKDARGPFDTAMRAIVMIALGVFVTTPLWCQNQATQNFGRTQFRAERADEETTEGQLGTIIRRVIETAARDEEVDEVAVMRELSTILADAELGTPESRAEATDQLIGNVLAQAAETSGMGFNQMQEQAIRSQARLMARSLVTQLGGSLGEADTDAPEGDWTPAAWPHLSSFEYEEGMELPPQAKALDEQQVMAWGYLLYLEGDQFLLVQSLWSCCFGRPPDLHEAIVIRADPANRRYEGRGVRVYGRFEAGEMREDGYVTSLYRLDAAHLRSM